MQDTQLIQASITLDFEPYLTIERSCVLTARVAVHCVRILLLHWHQLTMQERYSAFQLRWACFDFNLDFEKHSNQVHINMPRILPLSIFVRTSTLL